MIFKTIAYGLKYALVQFQRIQAGRSLSDRDFAGRRQTQK